MAEAGIKTVLHIAPFGGHLDAGVGRGVDRVVSSNAYGRSLALERLGYVVKRVESAPVGRFGPGTLANRIWCRAMGRWDRRTMMRDVLREAACFRPDVVMIEKGELLGEEDVRQVRTIVPERAIVAHINPDDPFGDYSKKWSRFLAAIPAYDIHFVPKAANEAEYHEKGAQAVVVYDRSFDPMLHKPVVLSDEERVRYGCDVGFIGSHAPHRERVLVELVRAQVRVAIWGNRWETGKYWRELKSVWRGPGQVGAAYPKALCGMKIALHFLRRENRDLQDSRTFEIPACRVFMLAERTADHERLFDDGREAVYFDSTEGLLANVAQYLDDEQSRIKIAEAGYLRAHSSGYDHDTRMRELMTSIARIRGNMTRSAVR